MKIDENPNPNSYGVSKSWLELPQDLYNSVFGRLGFVDHQRAKSVCSSWHSSLKQSVPKNHIHWLILFPENNNNNSCCTLFNPEETNKVYKTKDLGFEEFEKTLCIATYGSWLLMQDPRYNHYIMNLFTKEMINLPPREKGTIRCSVFWINEKTKDYVVLFGRFSRRGKLDVVYCSSKKGDNDNLSWREIPETSNCIHLVYKDHKLYYLSLLGSFKIFNFRESIPKEIFEGGAIVDRFGIGPVQLQPNNRLCLAATQLVVNVSGEIVFKVEKFVRPMSRTWSFRVSVIYSSGYLKKHKVIDSLGNEAMLLDEGVTVLAADNEGFIRNSIYFSDCSEKNKYHNFFRFDLETKKTEPLHEFDSSSLQFSRARWFLPNFTHT